MDGDDIPRPAAALRLDECVVLAQRNLIIANGEKSTIEPKIMDVLCVLADKPGEVFSREELADRVWGQGKGSDERLTRAISQLRKVMGDSSKTPRYIETVSKRGYRLVSPVVHETTENGCHAPSENPEIVTTQPRANRGTKSFSLLNGRPFLPLATAFLLGIVLGLFGALALMLFGL
jgi:DNA-binding winged helix-turn-helix (wHTH) protein